MKNELISIGKMAEINQITIATLRLYDKIGLLHPRFVDTETGELIETPIENIIGQ